MYKLWCLQHSMNEHKLALQSPDLACFREDTRTSALEKTNKLNDVVEWLSCSFGSPQET
jgi:hypothetical protein